jgi:hypothetical protein
MELEIISTSNEDIKNTLKLRLSNSKKSMEKIKSEISNKEEKFKQERLLNYSDEENSSDDYNVLIFNT